MSNSLLSWDDFTDDAAFDLAKKAEENLKNLDTSAATAELETQARDIEERKKLANINALNTNQKQSRQVQLQPIGIDMKGASAIMQRAVEALNSFKDDFEVGERIEAKQKRLINSQMDANQLVPFKYGWAWSMYLQSTEAHWMPAEATGYGVDIERWTKDTPQKFVTSEKKIIHRLCVNYMYSNYLYNPKMLVNLYRLMTSPECRQYVLRQCFEEQAFHHTVRHIIESFDLGYDDIQSVKLDEETFKDRNNKILPYISKLNDMHTTTDTLTDIGDFIVALATIYGGMKPLYHLVPMFQVVKMYKQQDKFIGVGKNVEWVLRDINRQYDFGIRLINGIVDENPEAFTEDVKERIVKVLKVFDVANKDLLSTNAVDSNDYAECAYASTWIMSHFARAIGVTNGVPVPPADPSKEWFVDYFLGLNGHKDHGNATVSLSGSESKGSLDWG